MAIYHFKREEESVLTEEEIGCIGAYLLLINCPSNEAIKKTSTFHQGSDDENSN
jgi:hypothetical protein